MQSLLETLRMSNHLSALIGNTLSNSGVSIERSLLLFAIPPWTLMM